MSKSKSKSKASPKPRAARAVKSQFCSCDTRSPEVPGVRLVHEASGAAGVASVERVVTLDGVPRYHVKRTPAPGADAELHGWTLHESKAFALAAQLAAE